jgi:hypothetical protein
MARHTHTPAVRLVVQSATQTHIDDMADLSRRTQIPRATDLAAALIPLEHPSPDLPPGAVVAEGPVFADAHDSSPLLLNPPPEAASASTDGSSARGTLRNKRRRRLLATRLSLSAITHLLPKHLEKSCVAGGIGSGRLWERVAGLKDGAGPPTS